MSILVSYAREDEPWVRDVLVASLRRQNFRVWWDRDDNFPGTSYKFVTAVAVRKCQAFVFVLSNTVCSQYGEAGYWEEFYAAQDRLLKLPPFQPFLFVVWKESPLNVPEVKVRPGELLEDFGRIELWGDRKAASDYRRIKQEFTRLVRQLERVSPRPTVEIDLSRKTTHKIGNRSFVVSIIAKLFLISLFFLAFVIVLPSVGGAIIRQYKLQGISDDVSLYFFGAGIIVWLLSALLVFTRLRK